MSYHVSNLGFSSYQAPVVDNTLVEDVSNMADRVIDGPTRVNSNGQAESMGVTRYDPTAPAYDNGHPLDTATDKYGRHVPFSQLSGDTLVTINGTTATLKQFEELGLAAYNGNQWAIEGQAATMDMQTREAEKQEEAEALQASVDFHPPVLEERLAEVIAPVPQNIWDAQIAKYSETMDINKVDVAGIAHSSGKSTEEVQQGLEFVKTVFTEQVKAALGGSTEEIVAWARTHRESDLKAATATLLQDRSLSGFKELQKAWQSDCSTEPQVHRAVHYLQSQGIATRRSPGGVWLVKTEQGEVSIENAFKQGWLKWGKGK